MSPPSALLGVSLCGWNPSKLTGEPTAERFGGLINHDDSRKREPEGRENLLTHGAGQGGTFNKAFR